jgi:cyclophilin family peptidyl-prolyl cis-trans isomerase
LALVNKIIEDSVADRTKAVQPYAFSAKQVEQYTGAGGTPHLDGSYTVFGEVIEGMEVVEWISKVKTDKRDRPLEDIRMKMKIVDE